MNNNNKWFKSFRNEFKYKFNSRKTILRDLRALDEMRDLITVASSISDFAKNNNKTIDDLYDEDIEQALRATNTILFDNGFEAYSSMNDKTKVVMVKYARSHYEHKPAMEDVEALAISGGGGKGQFYVGALKAMERDGLLKQIKVFAGASAGALTAIPLALGCTTKELMKIVESTDFRTFLIEGRNYNSEKKRDKKMLENEGLSFSSGSAGKDEQITNFINAIKVFAETHSPLAKNNKNLSFKDGMVSRFFNIPLSKPLTVDFKEENIEAICSELWSDRKIKRFCTHLMQSQNKKAGFEFHEFPEEILSMALAFTFEADYIEYYFGQLIKKKIAEYVDLGDGYFDLIAINPDMVNESNWANLSLKEIGQLARTESGKEFGFKDLVIGVTRTRITGEENRVSKFFKQFIGTKGIIVSSEPRKGDDSSLRKAPIRELARMSMAIPGFFANKDYGEHTYVDGGLHNNLPTQYFDKNGFDKKVLSLIPFTGSEIEKSNSVQEAFVHIPDSEKVSPLDLPGQVKNIFSQFIAGSANIVMMCGNRAYREMGLKESFRNIIVNTQQYGTLSFKAEGNDLYNLNKLSRRSYHGFFRDTDGSPSFFDSNYNSAVRFFEYKKIQHNNDNPEHFKRARAEYSEKKEVGTNEGFTSKIAFESLNHLIEKTDKSLESHGLNS